MDTVYDELLQIERALGAGDGDAYRRHLAEEAIVVIPGAALDRDACIDAMDASPGWDEFAISDVHALSLTTDSAMLSYRWRSRRGNELYVALMSSVYVRRDGSWRLVHHQQTPQPEGAGA